MRRSFSARHSSMSWAGLTSAPTDLAPLRVKLLSCTP